MLALKWRIQHMSLTAVQTRTKRRREYWTVRRYPDRSTERGSTGKRTRDTWDTGRRFHVCVFGALAEERWAESFLKMAKDIKPQSAEALHSLLGYLQRAVPLLRRCNAVSQRQRKLECSQNSKPCYFQRSTSKSDGKNWMKLEDNEVVLRMCWKKRKDCQPKILYPANVFSKTNVGKKRNVQTNKNRENLLSADLPRKQQQVLKEQEDNLRWKPRCAWRNEEYQEGKTYGKYKCQFTFKINNNDILYDWKYVEEKYWALAAQQVE